METNNQFTQINPDTYQGEIPKGTDLVVVNKDAENFDDAIILYGFDEVGDFNECFTNPIYGFLKF
jgi:hypothetical protein